jgi:RNA polymerase sigma-70 factor (ECF subfamily)
LSPKSSQLVSELFINLSSAESADWSAVLPLVYDELRNIAHRYFRNERPGHTLQSTALVHEAYMRLKKQDARQFANRAHFVAISAQLMRQILVEYGRSRRAAKRDGGQRLVLEDALQLGRGKSMDVVALDDALEELAKLDARQCRIVELRFFGGLSIEETGDILEISPATVKREWATARLWLHRELCRTPAP